MATQDEQLDRLIEAVERLTDTLQTLASPERTEVVRKLTDERFRTVTR